MVVEKARDGHADAERFRFRTGHLSSALDQVAQRLGKVLAIGRRGNGVDKRNLPGIIEQAGLCGCSANIDAEDSAKPHLDFRFNHSSIGFVAVGSYGM